MALDFVICIFSVPISGIATFRPSARDFTFRDGELVALARPDQEVALTFDDLASDGIVEEAVLQAIYDETFKAIEGLTNLPALGALEG